MLMFFNAGMDEYDEASIAISRAVSAFNCVLAMSGTGVPGVSLVSCIQATKMLCLVRRSFIS